MKTKISKEILVAVVVTAVVVGVLSFCAGYIVARGPKDTVMPPRFAADGFIGQGMTGDRAGVPGTRRAGANMAAGEVASLDETSLTLKLTGGGTRIVLFGKDAVVSSCEAGTLADLKEGTQVSVTGEANPDGSLTARFIQAGENMFVRAGQPAPRPDGAPAPTVPQQ